MMMVARMRVVVLALAAKVLGEFRSLIRELMLLQGQTVCVRLSAKCLSKKRVAISAVMMLSSVDITNDCTFQEGCQTSKFCPR